MKRFLPVLLLVLAAGTAFAQSWQYTGSMATPRRFQATLPLPDGNAMVIGGMDNTGYATATCEAWSPRTGAWSSLESMHTPRFRHTATQLPDGRIVVIGGSTTSFSYVLTGSIEIYDPATGHWSDGGTMLIPRMNHTATLLPNGTILVVAGFNGNFLKDCEIYDPTSKTSRKAAPLNLERMDHQAQALPDGRPLIAGGRIGGSDGTYLSNVEVYDPASDRWTTIGQMNQSRISGYALALFSDGALLAAGGRSGPNAAGDVAELLDMGTLDWHRVEPIKVPVSWPGCAMAPIDRYLMTGGMYEADWGSSSGTDVVPTHTCEWYDKVNGAWYFAPELNEQRAEHGAIYLHQSVNPELPSDIMLVMGGITGGSTITRSAEILDVGQSAMYNYMKNQPASVDLPASRGATSVEVIGNGGPSPLLQVTLARAGEISGELFSLDGRSMGALPKLSLAAGSHRVAIDATLRSGLYYLRLATPGGLVTEPLVVAR